MSDNIVHDLLHSIDQRLARLVEHAERQAQRDAKREEEYRTMLQGFANMMSATGVPGIEKMFAGQPGIETLQTKAEPCPICRMTFRPCLCETLDT